jgi:acyl carrier protein
MSMTYEDARKSAGERRELASRVKSLIVERLDLPIEPGWITDDQPLFGRGLELDSVDTLELMLGIDAEFDVPLTDEDRLAFGSVNRLVQRILEEER